MKTIGSRILVQVKSGDACTEKINGISVPVGAGEYEVATVLSVGKEITEVKENDEILIYIGAGKDFHYKSERYRVVTTNEIIVVL